MGEVEGAQVRQLIAYAVDRQRADKPAEAELHCTDGQRWRPLEELPLSRDVVLQRYGNGAAPTRDARRPERKKSWTPA
jgi:hypothetical protein